MKKSTFMLLKKGLGKENQAFRLSFLFALWITNTWNFTIFTIRQVGSMVNEQITLLIPTANWHYLQFPGHHFVADILGVFITNSSLLGSYVAVVSIPLKFEPYRIKQQK